MVLQTSWRHISDRHSLQNNIHAVKKTRLARQSSNVIVSFLQYAFIFELNFKFKFLSFFEAFINHSSISTHDLYLISRSLRKKINKQSCVITCEIIATLKQSN